ncbi:MAG: 5-(carboxyamino)imidazole ribonucleotide synthase [Rhodospirillaceae bacterium]|nr:5-(carboxyamino)imidazole ribonucleotide synthase [Rhodospirillaceae bacterium]
MATQTNSRLLLGATIGILGGGQLGRMLALAAARMGYRTHIFCPEADNPASQVATAASFADYGDEKALAEFASKVDVVTYEFENVPAATAAFLEKKKIVRPSWRALEVAQDRTKEKAFFTGIGVGVAPWRAVNTLDELRAGLGEIGTPAVLKTARLGYDGKGQAKILKAEDAEAAWRAIGGDKAKTHADGGPFAVLEGFVDFDCEISVIVARGADGEVRAFEPARNVHTHHILDTSTVPARVGANAVMAAIAATGKAATELGVVGLLAVEFFVTRDGKVLANEMAPRPHNSGHWTMDACQTDQFMQMVRAVCGLPLVDPSRFADATMKNLVGEDVNALDKYLADPNAHVHLYGKREARPGRKMGHVNIVKLPRA